MKAERLVFYRLYLFGMLFVLLQWIINTSGRLFRGDIYSDGYTKDWAAQLYVEIALLVFIIILIAVNKRIMVKWGGISFQAIGKVIILATFFIIAAVAVLSHNVLLMWAILLPIILLYALVLMAGQGVAINFLLGLRKDAAETYMLTNKSLFIVGALAVVAIYVNNYIIWQVTDLLVPPHYNTSFVSVNETLPAHLSGLITWAMVLAGIAFYHKKASFTPQPNIEAWVKTLVSLILLYLFLDKGHIYAYELLTGFTVDNLIFAYALAFIGAFAIHIYSFASRAKPISAFVLIRSALIVFSVFLLASFLEWQRYIDWGIFNILSLCAIVLFFILFSKQIAKLLAGGNGFGKLLEENTRTFQDRKDK